MKILLYIAILFSLNACEHFDMANPVPPHMRWMEKGPKPNPNGKPHNPLYVDGWVDGCHTGISASANSWYKSHYKFKQDAYKAQETVYYKGWKDAFNYCNRYIYQWHSRIGF